MPELDCIKQRTLDSSRSDYGSDVEETLDALVSMVAMSIAACESSCLNCSGTVWAVNSAYHSVLSSYTCSQIDEQVAVALQELLDEAADVAASQSALNKFASTSSPAETLSHSCVEALAEAHYNGQTGGLEVLGPLISADVQMLLERMYHLCSAHYNCQVNLGPCRTEQGLAHKSQTVSLTQLVYDHLQDILRDVLSSRRIRRSRGAKHILRHDLVLGDLAAPAQSTERSVVSPKDSLLLSQSIDASFSEVLSCSRAPSSHMQQPQIDSDLNYHPVSTDARFAISQTCAHRASDVKDIDESTTSPKLSMNLVRRLEKRAQALATLKAPYIRPRICNSVSNFAPVLPYEGIDAEARGDEHVLSDDCGRESSTMRQLKRPFRKHVLTPQISSQTIVCRNDLAAYSSDADDDVTELRATTGIRMHNRKRPRISLACKRSGAGSCVSNDVHEPTSDDEDSQADDNDAGIQDVIPQGSQQGRKALVPHRIAHSIRVSTRANTYSNAAQDSLDLCSQNGLDEMMAERHSIDRGSGSKKKDTPRKLCLPMLKKSHERLEHGRIGEIPVMQVPAIPSQAAAGNYQIPEGQSTGWETASGTKIEIAHDPELAAEWDRPAPAIVQTHNSRSPSHMRSRKALLKTNGAADPEYKALTDTYLRLQKQVNEVDEIVKQAQSALKCETRQEEPKLRNLIVKWRDVAQQACDELYQSTKERVDRAGGFREWQKSRQWSSWQTGSDTQHKQDEVEDDPYAPTIEEQEAMGIVEEGFSMHHLLSSMGIPTALIGWDTDLCCWT